MLRVLRSQKGAAGDKLTVLYDTLLATAPVDAPEETLLAGKVPLSLVRPAQPCPPLSSPPLAPGPVDCWIGDLWWEGTLQRAERGAGLEARAAALFAPGAPPRRVLPLTAYHSGDVPED